MFKYSLLKTKDFIKTNIKYIAIFFILYTIFVSYIHYFCGYSDMIALTTGAIKLQYEDLFINIFKLFLLSSLLFLVIKSESFSLNIASSCFVSRISKKQIVKKIIKTNFVLLFIIYLLAIIIGFVLNLNSQIFENEIMFIFYDFLFKILLCNLITFILNKKTKYIVILVPSLAICYLKYLLNNILLLIIINIIFYYIKIISFDFE